jgi:dihydrofolate reductase
MRGISLIVAMGANRVIGRANKMPWHLPADLQRFRRITMGKPIIMGRKTYESIGHPLPGRQNIVVTSSLDYVAPGCEVVHTVEEALRLARGEEIMVIGGGSLYRRFLPMADRLYITLIHRDYEGDTFFPDFDAEAWTEVERTEEYSDLATGLHYCFHVLERGERKGGSPHRPAITDKAQE